MPCASNEGETVPVSTPPLAPITPQPSPKPPGTLIVSVASDSGALDQATVKIDGAVSKVDNTKPDGTVTFTGLIDGPYLVSASKACFIPKALPNPVQVPGGGTANASIQLAPCKTLTLTPAAASICGKNKTAILTAMPDCAGGTFAWSSSNNAVATVAGSAGTGTVTSVGTGNTTITVEYSISGCTKLTATAAVKVCICTSPSASTRFYSFAQKLVASLTGVKANIKTKYGKLCCEDLNCTDVAMKCTYVNISNGGKWAQMGYRRIRNAGSSTANNFLYTEMNGSVYKVKDDAGAAPAEGSNHEYRVELDSTNGTWNFLVDGSSTNTFQDNDWKTMLGAVAHWPGEIVNREDDMSGTASDKCNFTGCQYKTGIGSYVNAGLAAGDLRTDDATEWANELVSGTAFNIWDKKPNP